MQSEIEKSIEKLRNGELLKEKDVRSLCARVREIFVEEGNVQRIDAPVTVVGDIHGQLYDLLEIFKLGGEPPDINYLFLGDYVNRGFHSIESICLLYAIKVTAS
jgi:serine/threonine-protein phosphatase 4 catalytic subunit